jgi:hypothetical protein
MDYYNDPNLTHDRGVRLDHKGRLIVTLPTHSVDDFAFISDDDEPSIAELMRRDVNVRLGGSKGRRRRRAPKNKGVKARPVRADNPLQTSRIGRPARGAEVRVYVQTSIARRTREILTANGLTLADVFDACARELAYVS